MVLGYQFRNRNTHGQTCYSLGRQAFQNYGQEGESIYSISRGALKRMIDLAEQAGAEFFFEQKIWDVTLSEATLHIGETEGELGKKKYEIVLVLMVLFLEYATACNIKYV
jgi:flavin-dependent dehydrogenase